MGGLGERRQHIHTHTHIRTHTSCIPARATACDGDSLSVARLSVPRQSCGPRARNDVEMRDARCEMGCTFSPSPVHAHTHVKMFMHMHAHTNIHTHALTHPYTECCPATNSA